MLRGLQWSDIEDNTIRVVGRTKTLRERGVTLIPQARSILASLPRSSHLVLSGQNGGPVNVEYASKVFLRCRKLAKLPDRHKMYSLRHTFAAEYIRRGGSIRLLKDEMGHYSVTTTERYGQLGVGERTEITQRLFAATG
ncbi:MAG: integrase [Rhodothermales bacterium]|jgi:integrase